MASLGGGYGNFHAIPRWNYPEYGSAFHCKQPAQVSVGNAVCDYILYFNFSFVDSFKRMAFG